MTKIVIEFITNVDDDPLITFTGWKVSVGDRFADGLCFGEMIEQVVGIACRDDGASNLRFRSGEVYRMKTAEEWRSEHDRRFNSMPWQDPIC